MDRGGSNEYPTIYVLNRNMKKYQRIFFFFFFFFFFSFLLLFFFSENFQFLEVKFSVYLNRRVFVIAAFCDLGLPDIYLYYF